MVAPSNTNPLLCLSMPRISVFATLLLGCLIQGTAQERTRRLEIQESVQAKYPLTKLGAGVLGIRGNDNTVRRVGGIVVLKKEGLYGSFNRSLMPVNAIRGESAELLAGKREESIPLSPGQRFYVVAASVSDDAVTIGLLSTGPVSSGRGTGDLWASLNFFFSKETIGQGRVEQIFPELDSWLVAPGEPWAGAPANAPAAPVPPAVSAPVAAAPATSQPIIELQPGMEKAQIVNALGAPQRSVSFADRLWLEYPGLVAVLENGKLVGIEYAGAFGVVVKISSDPASAEVYVDGSFAGSTATSLRLQPGMHKISVKAPGYQEWERELKVFPGSEVHVDATLTKKTP
jgi:PEGA domain-containing protein